MKLEEVKILLCEDNEALTSLMKFKLSRAGFKNCTVALDGKQAKAHLEEGEFDVLITDIHMPFVSGLELTTYVRKIMHSEMPIIVLSSEGVEDTVVEGFNLGINDFLTKPFSPNELIIRLQRLTKV